jgi:UDP-2-acetamido-3-amino-2,3-dideoxy-glucuronate N-acetyltransferase
MPDRRVGSSSSTNAQGTVHPTAVVEPGASIGRGTAVWHHSHVRVGAEIGQDVTLGKNVFVDAGASIGDRVKVQNNVSVYRGVTIDDDVFVGPSAVFTNDLHPRAFSSHWTVTPTHVRRGASIGANATIVCGIEIGEFAMIAAGAVVTRDVAPFRLVAGCPAWPVGWVCTCGATMACGAADDAPPPPQADCATCGLPWRRGL